AEQGEQPVVASAARQRPDTIACGYLEDYAGIVVERTPEGRVIADRRGRQAFSLDRLDARTETAKRHTQRQTRRFREIVQRRGGPIQRHVDGEEGFQSREGIRRKPDRTQFALLHQTARNLL